MAEITYDEVLASKKEYDVGFFSMKPNTEVLVRIMCDSMSDLKILTVHPVTVGNSTFPNKNVNCIRNAQEPIEQCPLCAAGVDVKQKVFIKMIQYDEQTHEGKAVVWDRPASAYVTMLKKYMDNYGPLSNIFCKVSRTGTGRDTRYDIIPNVNPQVYNDSNFPRKDNAFDNFNLLDGMVLNKNAMEMNEFIRTGNFPMTNQNSTETNTTIPASPQAYTPIPETPAAVVQPNVTPTTPQGIPNGYQQPYVPTQQAAPVAEATPQMERPQRYY